MQGLSISEAKEALRELIPNDPEIKHRCIYGSPGKNDFKVSSDSLSIPKLILSNPGIYTCEVLRLKEKGEAETVTSIAFEVPPKQAKPGPEPTRPLSGLESPADVLLALREQDRQSWEQEREFYRAQLQDLRDSHKREIETLRDKYEADLRRERESYEFRLKYVEGNQAKLDEEREKIGSRQFELAKKELSASRRNKQDDDLSIKDIIQLATTFTGNGNGKTPDLSKFREE